MKKIVFVIALLVCGLGYAQDGRIHGNVKDGALNNEPLAFAKVRIKNTDQVAVSDLNGLFSFDLKPGTYTLVYEFAGYQSVVLENIVVKEAVVDLKDVALHAKKITFENSIASKG